MDEIDLNRRQLFSRGIAKAGNAGLELLEQRAQNKARGWLRPPFALAELDFLLACTRCDACMEACPHQVIFLLPLTRGPEVVGTPALDLLNKGCHLCADWPCVEVCEPGALGFPVSETTADAEPGPADAAQLPAKLSTVAIDTARCLPYSGPECGACAGSCPVPGALLWQEEKPVIDDSVCVGCALCREACILEPKAISVASVATGTENAQQA